MALVFTQSAEQKSAFLTRIAEKETAKVQCVRDRVRAETPKIFHWALKPLATAMVTRQQGHARGQGARGELSVSRRLRSRLPKTWAIINDVVLEYQPGKYTQIDHIAIGPGGIFLIETKAWAGAIQLKNDQCFRKEAGKWVKTQSPIHQNNTHRRRFCEWYKLHGLPQPLPPIEPLVVFTRTRCLVVDQCSCSMPVLTPQKALVYLRTRGSVGPLDEASLDRVVDEILTAAPLSATAHHTPSRFSSPADTPLPLNHPTEPDGFEIRERTSRAGRKYVRVRGTLEAAHEVWEQYGKPGKLAVDRFDQNVFFFYCD